MINKKFSLCMGMPVLWFFFLIWDFSSLAPQD